MYLTLIIPSGLEMFTPQQMLFISYSQVNLCETGKYTSKLYIVQ